MINSTSNHFSCLSGGSWYACPNEPRFVGCCSSDPCTNVPANSTTPCPDIYPASFDPSIYSEIAANDCIGAANSNWFTCNFTDPPFLGCCSRNTQCNESMIVCPADDLLAAAWSDGQYALFQDKGTSDDDNGNSGGGDGLSGGAIAGIVVGAVAALVIVGALVWFFMRRRNKKATAMSGNGHMPSVVQGEHQSVYPGEYGYGYRNQHPSPASASYDSRFSSPAGTTIGAGNTKHMSNSSAGTSLPSFSPALPSESGRQIHEIHSIAGSEIMSQQTWTSSQNYGLGMHGAQKPEPIQELDSGMVEAHELEAGSRP
ncbi:hypothetical protein N7488_010598 [Penicillium malachiteum]|nr:hypothetical protein N7488_010598 [Penicillium malachiteum]